MLRVIKKKLLGFHLVRHTQEDAFLGDLSPLAQTAVAMLDSHVGDSPSSSDGDETLVGVAAPVQAVMRGAGGRGTQGIDLPPAQVPLRLVESARAGRQAG